jgi:hypothetical protein
LPTFEKCDIPPGVSVVPFSRHHQRVAMLIPEGLLTGKFNLHPRKLTGDSVASFFHIYLSRFSSTGPNLTHFSYPLFRNGVQFRRVFGKLDRVDTRQKQLHEPFQAQISAPQARPIYCRLMISLKSCQEGYTTR